jgi:23S rRNA (cytosine1962-C5)-methyltransferase
MPEIVLKPGREKSVIKRHPWIFSGAIARINGSPKPGETVDVISSLGEVLARASINPKSNIAGRIWTWDPNEQVDRHFFEMKLFRSIESRQRLIGEIDSNAMRMVNAESDGIPGLIMDKYGDSYVVQFLTAGIDHWKAELIDIIQRLTSASIIYERSDVDARKLEGLPIKNGILFGELRHNPIEIIEHGVKYLVDITEGHKTGFYLDQRENRLLARKISSGRNVLDCFSYTGGFAVNCLIGNAKRVILVDSSDLALKGARKNILINRLNAENADFIAQDVFKYLRILRDRGETFDMVILDPPKFAPTFSQVERAARGYKDINLLALKILNKGGFLLSFSCSGGVNEELFQKIVAGAALDAGIYAVILKRLHQDVDHPVALNFPEGAYLKGFLIQKLN